MERFISQVEEWGAKDAAVVDPELSDDSGDSQPRSSAERARRDRMESAKYRRARLRNLVFAVGPNRLTRGRLVERHLTRPVCVRTLDVTSPFWPRAFDGMRIAHVSDFHLGSLLPIKHALEIVRLIRDQSPDLVACTGDVVDLDNDDARPLLDALANVEAPMGSLMVLGNHDHLHDGDELTDMARGAGLTVLHNECIRLGRDTDPRNRLIIGGIDWAKSVNRCAARVDRACGDFAHLLLAHNPKAFHRAAALRIPLTLSGHTHGGQLALRTRPRTNLAFTHRRSAGLYDSRGSRLFVTTGVGAWFPLRVNCPAEVAILTLRRAEVPPHEHGIGATRRPGRRRRA